MTLNSKWLVFPSQETLTCTRDPTGPTSAKAKAMLFSRRGSARGSGGGGGAGRSKPSPTAAADSAAGGPISPLVWAEVYCGSAEAGRWVHVDILGGSVNK